MGSIQTRFVVSHAEANRRILYALRDHGRLDPAGIVGATHLPQDIVGKTVKYLLKQEPPLINRVGVSEFFQLSVEGCKRMGVQQVHTASVIQAFDAVSSSYSPTVPLSARGLLVRALKEKRRSVHELARETHLNETQVRYFLRTLRDRGLLQEDVRASNDGRIVLYGLKTVVYDEPEAPILTPAVVPLCDEGDWHTWMERLLVEQYGGSAIVEPAPETESTLAPKPEQRVRLPKVLLIGWFKGDFANRIRINFVGRLDLRFVDTDSAKSVEAVSRKMDYVVIRCDHCTHDFDLSVRKANKKPIYVKGNAARICKELERLCV